MLPTTQALDGTVLDYRTLPKLGTTTDSPRTGGGGRERGLRADGGVGWKLEMIRRRDDCKPTVVGATSP